MPNLRRSTKPSKRQSTPPNETLSGGKTLPMFFTSAEGRHMFKFLHSILYVPPISDIVASPRVQDGTCRKMTPPRRRAVEHDTSLVMSRCWTARRQCMALQLDQRKQRSRPERNGPNAGSNENGDLSPQSETHRSPGRISQDGLRAQRKKTLGSAVSATGRVLERNDGHA